MTQWNINAVVQGLQQARHDWRQQQHRTKEFGGRELPSKEALKAILDDLCGILFPMRLGPADLRQETEDSYIAYTLNRVLTALHAQVQLALNYEAKRHLGHSSTDQQPQELAQTIVQDFANTLPSIRRLLDGDVRAAYEGDPAAHSVDEVLLCYPGIFAIIITELRISSMLKCLYCHALFRSWPTLLRVLIFIRVHKSAKGFSLIMVRVW